MRPRLGDEGFRAAARRASLARPVVKPLIKGALAVTKKAFASSADLAETAQPLEVLDDGVYALTAEGDPNIGAVEGEYFLVCFDALATPFAAAYWFAKLRDHTDIPVRFLVLSHY